MLTLYDYLPSQNAFKVRLLLNHLEIAYRTEIVSIFEGEGQSEAYLAISPTGAVPALRLENGGVLAESNAILVYLAEGSAYLPTDAFARARVLQWLFFEGEYVQSTVATLRHWVLTGKDRSRSADLMAGKRTGTLKTLSILDRELRRNTYLGGNHYTIADMSVFAYVHRADETGVAVSEYTNLTRWLDDVRSQPRFLSEVYPYSIDPYSALELP